MCVKFCMSRENLCGIFWGCMENPDFGAMWNFATAKPGFGICVEFGQYRNPDFGAVWNFATTKPGFWKWVEFLVYRTRRLVQCGIFWTCPKR